MAAFRKRSKSCPFLSQEFFIQNHADIVSCLVVLVLIGLMFEVTAKTAFMFISPQNNVSTVTPDGEVVYYLYGTSDFVTILFYICITIILHAVVQEYALDKLNKRLHLSKIKHSKLNESGQLIVLHLTSGIWGFYIAVTEGYVTNPNSLWDKYPHTELSFQVKFFFLCQLSYWIHSLPELYFQRVRKEEIPRQLQYIGLYLLHIAGAYLLNFNAWAVVFVMTRLMTLTLTVLVVGFGLSRVEHQTFDMERGIFNSLPIRLCILVTVCSTQAWMMWRFINFQLRRWREFQAEQASRRKIVGAMAMRGRVVRRELGHHENGLIKSENGTSPRTRKSKSP
ncbi:translocating chain-associated membrane protein 2 isoform X2 [Stegostoma tigrinum]|uniref:translocating chain-associated membrane protein 2 isoform X2 n=1 Tax=Stegostoma tigrinum TaxID=3053191 RepID=UPI00202B80C8|nr:translocating chain-associated membrane protein 2 isoform X2 [Stegostoma tigrinum]